MDNEDDQAGQTNPPVEQAPMQTPHQAAKHGAQKRKKLFLIGGGAGLLLLLGAGAVYWFVLKGDGAKSTAKSTSQQTQQPTEQIPSTPSDATPVTYKNAKLNIELTHRKDWTLKETSSGSEITLTSPRISYSKADGSATMGVFTLKIRKGITDAMKSTVDAAVASRDSEVIGYTAPTEQQRHFTNVSYGGGKESFNFFMVTGSTEFKSGQPFAFVLTFDNDTFLIAGGYGTDKNNTLSFDSVPKTAIDSEAKEQAIDIVESLKIF